MGVIWLEEGAGCSIGFTKQGAARIFLPLKPNSAEYPPAKIKTTKSSS
jgi:hypothetical protein